VREEIAEYALERAAIMEYEAGLSREEAERRAKAEVRAKFRGKQCRPSQNSMSTSQTGCTTG